MSKNPIPMSNQNSPITSKQIIETLGLTIKKDNDNKLATFLCCLSAFTEDSQFNISFNAPSSSGKSYIPLEVSSLFPEEDLIVLGSCSPTSFFHEQGKYDKETNMTTIDLSRKIIIFLDQPNHDLLVKLRPLLSHDQKEIISKITDRKEKGGHRTKTIKIIGFPAVIFCSASVKSDEQESTRFLMLSPDLNQEKIRQAILSKIDRETNKEEFDKKISDNLDRQELIKHIQTIKSAQIKNIVITNPSLVEEKFFSQKSKLKPRDQRDISRFISLIKCFALLNCPHRKIINNSIIVTEEDIKNAYELWSRLSISQELNISPYLYNILQNIIVPLYLEKNPRHPKTRTGISRSEILKKYYQVNQYPLSEYKLRQDILPMLDNAGLITQEHGPDNKQKLLVFPQLN